MKIVALKRMFGHRLYGLGLFRRFLGVCLLLACCGVVVFCCFDHKIAAGLLLITLSAADAALLWLWMLASHNPDGWEEGLGVVGEGRDSAKMHDQHSHD